MEKRFELGPGRDVRLAAGAGAFAAYMSVVLFWVLRQPGGDAAARLVGVMHLLPALVAAVICGRLAMQRASSWQGRMGWAALGLGSLAFAVAQGADTYDRIFARVPSAFPAFFDLFYLASYPCLFVGFLGLSLERGWSSRPRVLLDRLISLSPFLALSWYFVLKPLAGGYPFGIAAVRLAFPLLDLGILFWALVLSHGSLPSPSALSSQLLVVSAACIALTDTGYAYLTLHRAFPAVGVLDVGWAGGFALLALGSLARCGVSARESSQGDGLGLSESPSQTETWTAWAAVRVVVPVLATVGAVLVIMGHDFRTDGSVALDVIAVSFTLVTSMMVRQVLTLVEHGQVHSDLHVFNRRLEEKVRERTRQLETLHEIARAANSSLRIEEMLEQVMQRVAEAFPAEAAAVWLLEERGDSAGELSLCGQTGLDAATHGPMLEMIPARWKSGLDQVLMERHSLPVPFVSADGARSDNGTAPECLCAVIEWQGKALGVLGAVRWRSRFGDAERSLLESVALELASSLQNAHLYNMAVSAADRDGVTNLLNHRAVVQRLEEECKRSERTGLSMATLLLDLNNFKLFNDTHGHLVGDQVLKTTASLLAGVARASDVIGRYGGDEFIIVCPATDSNGARDLASRIHERLSRTTVQGTGGERLPLAASIGLAVYPDGARSQHELLALADMNMYDAKVQGGSSIVGCEDPEGESNDFIGGFSTLDALVTAVDKRDHYTRRHSEDVTEFSLMIAEQMGLSQDTMRTLRLAGLLHDLGKIAIPDSILKKPSALTDEEFEVMKQHPVYGWLIVSAIPNLSETLPAIRHHHERFDGRGYPDGLAGDDIPMLGRLMAVADAFSAMTTDRPYRKGMPRAQALDQLLKGSGTQFDPAMVDAFMVALVRNSKAAA